MSNPDPVDGYLGYLKLEMTIKSDASSPRMFRGVQCVIRSRIAKGLARNAT